MCRFRLSSCVEAPKLPSEGFVFVSFFLPLFFSPHFPLFFLCLSIDQHREGQLVSLLKVPTRTVDGGRRMAATHIPPTFAHRAWSRAVLFMRGIMEIESSQGLLAVRIERPA
jgi:hypothetical protein